MPPIVGSRSPCKSDVAAPIDLPHKPIVETLRFARRYSVTQATSSRSNQPREMYSPSDRPLPEKSKQNSVILADRSGLTRSSASSLQLEFP